jgi:hypothetical protein
MHQRWAILYHGKIYLNTPGGDFTLESPLAKPLELDWWAYTLCITLQGWARLHLIFIIIKRQGWEGAGEEARLQMTLSNITSSGTGSYFTFTINSGFTIS